MNLYIFNAARRAAVYGIGTFSDELVHALRDSNITVSVINIRQDTPCFKIEEINGISYWHVPKPQSEQPVNDFDDQSDYYYLNIIYLFQLYIKDKSDLIFHLNYYFSIAFIEALKKNFNCRIVTTVHYLRWCFNLLGNMKRFRKIMASDQTVQDDIYHCRHGAYAFFS